MTAKLAICGGYPKLALDAESTNLPAMILWLDTSLLALTVKSTLLTDWRGFFITEFRRLVTLTTSMETRRTTESSICETFLEALIFKINGALCQTRQAVFLE